MVGWFLFSIFMLLAVAGVVGAYFPNGERWLASQVVFYTALPVLVVAWASLGIAGVLT